jgi:rhodanese-related sulfurtransferase
MFMFFGNLTDRNILGNVSPFSSLPIDQFSRALDSGNYTLIDVRTLDEYNAGHLKNAKQTDYTQAQQFSKYLELLDKDNKYLIYCRSGIKSAKSMQIMRDKGFTNVYDMSGGYKAWIAGGYSVEK